MKLKTILQITALVALACAIFAVGNITGVILKLGYDEPAQSVGAVGSQAATNLDSLTLSGTLNAEQVTSTDDATVTDDLDVGGDIDVDGTANLDVTDVDGAADFATSVTVGGLLYPSFANATITDGDTLTPTKTVYALDSAGAVTVTLAASGAEGQLLILIGDDSNDITVADTNIRTNDGSAQVLNVYDVLMLVYQDSEWLEISESNDS